MEKNNPMALWEAFCLAKSLERYYIDLSLNHAKELEEIRMAKYKPFEIKIDDSIKGDMLKLHADTLITQKKEKLQFRYFKKNSTSILYEFCNKYQYFTSGTIKQYQAFFDRAKNAPKEVTLKQYLSELSAIIWICSDGKDDIDTIRKSLFETYICSIGDVK